MRRRFRVLVVAAYVAVGAVGVLQPASAAAYNPDKAVTWANNHAASALYPNYPNPGNDCASFVSAAMHDSQGGGMAYRHLGGDLTKYANWWMTRDAQWHFAYTLTWVGASNLLDFLSTSGIGNGRWYMTNASTGHMPRATVMDGNANGLRTGDLVFYD